MEEIEKIRRRIRRETEEAFDADEDSDIPIAEKRVKDRKIRII